MTLDSVRRSTAAQRFRAARWLYAKATWNATRFHRLDNPPRSFLDRVLVTIRAWRSFR